MTRKLYIKTYGCQMNEYDSAKMADVLAASHGLSTAAAPEDADVLLLTMGALGETAMTAVDRRRERGQKVGLIRLRLWRPFPFDDLFAAIGDKPVLVIPGIRPAGSATDDQQRIATPASALRDGADVASLDQQVRLFAQYARQPGNDLDALIAVMRRPPGTELSAETVAAVTCPVLVVVGENDFVHPADGFASALPDARVVTLPGTDHFATTDSFGFYDAALEFVGAL